MRLLLFSDPHITTKSAFSRPTDDGLTSYLKQVSASFRWLCKLVIDEEPDLVVCLGDVTETTGYVEAQSLKVATRCFMELAEACKESGSSVHVLVGNHDSYSTQHNIHNLEFLRGIERLSISDKQGPVPGVPEVYCMPWGSDPSVELPPQTQVVLSHLDIKGSTLYKTTKSDGGADPAQFSVPVFNGHFHNPNQPHTNVQNIGAMLSRSFGDVDSPPRGAYIVQLGGSNEMEWYTTESGAMANRMKLVTVEKFIQNPHEIPFRDVLVEDEMQAGEALERLETGATGLEDCYLRIKYKQEFKEVAEQFGSLSQGARLELIVGEVSLASKSPQLSKDHFSAEQAYTRYAEHNSSHLAKLAQESLLLAGLEYLKRAASEIRVHTMPIEFERLEATYFQSLGLNFQFSLDQGGLWYVAGRNEDDPYDANGVGKSTVPEVIYWILTGESLRGYKGDDVIHWQHEFCKGTLWLKIGDHRYMIFRARKDPEEGDAVQLWDVSAPDYCNLGVRRKKDTTELIAELIGRSKKVLQHSVFLTSGLAQRFTSLSYPDRIRLIEEITDVGVFAKAGKLAEKDFEAEARKLQMLKGARDALTSTLARVETRVKQLLAEHDKLSHDAEPRMEQLRRDKNEHEARSKQLVVLVDESAARHKSLDGKLGAMDHKFRLFADENTKLVTQISQLQTTLTLLESRIVEAETLISSGRCPTCGQQISTEAPVCVSLDEMRAEAVTLAQQLQPLHVKYQRLDESRNRLKMVLDSDRTAASTLRDELDEHRGSLDVETRALNRIEQELTSTQSKLESAASTIAEQRTLQESTNAELANTDRQLEVSNSRIEQLNWLVDAFSTTGVRADVLFQVSLPYLNSKIQEYSTKLGQPCQLDYRQTKSGDLEEKVEVALPGKKSYKGLSRGEKMMVDLSIQCALNDLAVATGGSHVNLLICDEVIDAIDEPTLKAFVDILESKAGAMTIFLMAHRPFLDARLPHKLLLVKKDGVTYLEGSQ